MHNIYFSHNHLSPTINDYSARYYESAVGRFTSVDPHAENYYSWSPYAYVMNNPLRFIDPTGMVHVDGKDSFNELRATDEERREHKKKEMEEFRIWERVPYKATNSSPTDIYDHTGSKLVYRGDNKDGKNEIEVRLPEYVVEAKAPRKPSNGTVAIAWDYVSLDAQFGGAVAKGKSVIKILKGPYAGEEYTVNNTTLGVGSLGISGTMGITLYTYYGKLEDVTPYLFEGDSKVVNTSYELGPSFNFGQTSSRSETGGVLRGRALSIGVGIGPPVSIYTGTTSTKIY